MRAPNPRVFQVVVLVAVTAVCTVSAQAVVYTNAFVKGSYGFLLNKWTADATEGQDAVLGVMHFDGLGNVTGSFKDMNRGALTTGTATGTYSVNANGTGTMTLTTNLGGTQQFAMVLSTILAKVATNLQLLITNDSSNEFECGSAVLQTSAAATYTLTSLKGVLAFQLNSWTDDLTQDRTDVVGLFNFSGAGKVTATFTEMKKGALSTGTATGTYTVNADGSGTMSLVSGTDSFQVAVVLNTVAVNKTTGLGVAKSLQLLQITETTNRVESGIALK